MLMTQYAEKEAELTICFFVDPVMLLPTTDMTTV